MSHDIEQEVMATKVEAPVSKSGSALSDRKWKVRNYRLEDAYALEELSATVFKESRPAQHFVWKFHRNPAGNGINMVAEHSNRIIGHYSMLPTWLRVGDEVVYGVQACDLMVHADFRNQGMFIALQEACTDAAIAKGVEAGYGFPNENSYHGLVFRMNWDHPNDIPYWLRILDSSAVKGRYRRVRHLASLGLRFLPMGSTRGVEIRNEKPSDEEMVSLAELENSNVTRHACSVQRSVDWFRWRFDPESQRRYVWCSAYRHDKLEAWTAFGLNDWGESPMIDMMGSNPHSLEAVVSAATCQAKKLRVPALVAYTNKEDAIRALRSCGYLRHGSIPLTVRQLTLRTLDANLHSHSSWRISSQDFDTF